MERLVKPRGAQHLGNAVGFSHPRSGNLFNYLLFLGPFSGCGIEVSQANRCLDTKYVAESRPSLDPFPISWNIFFTFVRLEMQIIG